MWPDLEEFHKKRHQNGVNSPQRRSRCVVSENAWRKKMLCITPAIFRYQQSHWWHCSTRRYRGVMLNDTLVKEHDGNIYHQYKHSRSSNPSDVQQQRLIIVHNSYLEIGWHQVIALDTNTVRNFFWIFEILSFFSSMKSPMIAILQNPQRKVLGK